MDDPSVIFKSVFHAEYWAGVPFHFWSVVVFCLGCIVGSFLNVVIYRLPLGKSIVSPPSHCPHCNYAIPWYLNIPLVTWLCLRGKCKNCDAPISVRYFLVELLTGLLFWGAWSGYGENWPGVALVYAFFLALLVAATFIDFEHFIIPDQITLGGAAAGLLFSCIFPIMHDGSSLAAGMRGSLFGIGFGAALVYIILRAGKLVFGREKISIPPGSRIVFGEDAIHLPDRDVPYEEVFYRDSDTITLQATTLELVDRCYKDVGVRLSPGSLMIGEERLEPEDIRHMEALTSTVVLPREAMGLGDVKFMAAIGAFLGWQGVLFSLMVSSLLGAVVGVALIVAGKRRWSSLIPYGPYIAVAAALWLFGGRDLTRWWFERPTL